MNKRIFNKSSMENTLELNPNKIEEMQELIVNTISVAEFDLQDVSTWNDYISCDKTVSTVWLYSGY